MSYPATRATKETIANLHQAQFPHLSQASRDHPRDHRLLCLRPDPSTPEDQAGTVVHTDRYRVTAESHRPYQGGLACLDQRPLRPHRWDPGDPQGRVSPDGMCSLKQRIKTCFLMSDW